MIKILIVSRSPWRKDNSFGNTYSNFFSKMEDVQIANICLTGGTPEYEKNVTDYFQITEQDVMKAFLKNQKVCGRRVIAEKPEELEHVVDSKGLKIAKKLRWQILYMVREAIWATGKWDTEELEEFVYEFKPDIVFQPFYYALYPNRVGLYFSKKYNIPMVLEASIDIYTMKQISFSPLFWIDRLIKRSMVREMVNNGKLLYVISEKQKRDYSRIFNIECKVLHKNASFSNTGLTESDVNSIHDNPLIVYTGNLGDGRWKTVVLVASALKKAGLGYLKIYSQTPLTPKMKAQLNIDGFSEFIGAVSSSEAMNIQKHADILLHVESFDLRNKLSVRYSISTKIMDYLSKGKCVLAVGPEDVASMEYLRQNGCVYAIGTKDEVERKIKILITNAKLIHELSSDQTKCKEFYVNQTRKIREDVGRICGK